MGEWIEGEREAFVGISGAYNLCFGGAHSYATDSSLTGPADYGMAKGLCLPQPSGTQLDQGSTSQDLHNH